MVKKSSVHKTVNRFHRKVSRFAQNIGSYEENIKRKNVHDTEAVVHKI